MLFLLKAPFRDFTAPSVNFLQQPRNIATAALEQCSSYPVTLLQSLWSKFPRRVWKLIVQFCPSDCGVVVYFFITLQANIGPSQAHAT